MVECQVSFSKEALTYHGGEEDRVDHQQNLYVLGDWLLTMSDVLQENQLGALGAQPQQLGALGQHLPSN